MVRKEGFFALWKGKGGGWLGTRSDFCEACRSSRPRPLPQGFLPYYARIGPHTVITFIFLEQLNQAYRRFVAKKA